MTNGRLHVTSEPPVAPDEADFAIYIDFKKGEGDPLRVFRAADQTIKALQTLDRALCRSVDASIESLLVLEDIEAGSLRIWLRNVLVSTDDQAIKTLNWKPAIGKYLVRAKYVYLDWVNKADGRASLSELGQDLKKIAEETDVKHLPDYAPPNAGELVAATKEINAAKGALIDGDSMKYISQEAGSVDFDLSVIVDTVRLEDMAIKDITKFANMQMSLVVRRPDYLGTSQWEFRHGPKTIPAKISDANWLQRFQSRQIDVRPGDALKCSVTVEYGYGFDNELVRESYTIETVIDVLVNQVSHQVKLLPDKNDDRKG